MNTDDPVNHPPHYTGGEIECIDVLEQLDRDGNDFRIITAIKYLWRWHLKNGTEDLRKAQWYINRVIEENKHDVPTD